jgi:hypothetical protein
MRGSSIQSGLKEALGTDSHRGHLHCLLHIFNSLSRTAFTCRVVTEQIEHQYGQKQDADDSHLVLHTLHAFRSHAFITLHIGRDCGNDVSRSSLCIWSARCGSGMVGGVPLWSCRRT